MLNCFTVMLMGFIPAFYVLYVLVKFGFYKMFGGKKSLTKFWKEY